MRKDMLAWDGPLHAGAPSLPACVLTLRAAAATPRERGRRHLDSRSATCLGHGLCEMPRRVADLGHGSVENRPGSLRPAAAGTPPGARSAPSRRRAAARRVRCGAALRRRAASAPPRTSPAPTSRTAFLVAAVLGRAAVAAGDALASAAAPFFWERGPRAQRVDLVGQRV